MINEIRAYQQEISNTGNTPAKERAAAMPRELERARMSVDTVEIGAHQSSSVLYDKKAGKGLTATDINALRAHAEKNLSGLRELVRQLLQKQREAAAPHGKRPADAGDAMPTEEAALSLLDDGEFGVKAVSDRIVNFAIAVSGDDPQKLAQLKDAIDKGFAEAEKAFGGSLPGICYDTHKEIMRKLDQWAGGTQQL